MKLKSFKELPKDPTRHTPIKVKRPPKIVGHKSLRHYRLWNILNGVMDDVLKMHPDYFTEKGKWSVKDSILKRAVGTLEAAERQGGKVR